MAGTIDPRDGCDTRMYIALTRSAAQAVVVAKGDEVAQDPRLARPRAGGGAT